jgi:hypothetical protein
MSDQYFSLLQGRPNWLLVDEEAIHNAPSYRVVTQNLFAILHMECPLLSVTYHKERHNSNIVLGRIEFAIFPENKYQKGNRRKIARSVKIKHSSSHGPYMRIDQIRERAQELQDIKAAQNEIEEKIKERRHTEVERIERMGNELGIAQHPGDRIDYSLNNDTYTLSMRFKCSEEEMKGIYRMVRGLLGGEK